MRRGGPSRLASFRKVVHIGLSARVMLTAMMRNMLSARAMLVQYGALYAHGRARTMPDFHEKFLWLKRCTT